jgi:hypothetical protein
MLLHLRVNLLRQEGLRLECGREKGFSRGIPQSLTQKAATILWRGEKCSEQFTKRLRSLTTKGSTASLTAGAVPTYLS